MTRQVVCCIIALLTLVTPAGSFAQTTPQPRSAYESIPGFNLAETPNQLDRIAFMRHWFGGPRPGPSPRAVLILVPGFFGSAEDFRYVGERLVRRLPWLHCRGARPTAIPTRACGTVQLNSPYLSQRQRPSGWPNGISPSNFRTCGS